MAFVFFLPPSLSPPPTSKLSLAISALRTPSAMRKMFMHRQALGPEPGPTWLGDSYGVWCRCTIGNSHRQRTVTCHADVLGLKGLGCPTSACQRFVLNQCLEQALVHVAHINLRGGCWLPKRQFGFRTARYSCLIMLDVALERLRDSGPDVARGELLDILIRMLHLGGRGGRLMETRTCVASDWPDWSEGLSVPAA